MEGSGRLGMPNAGHSATCTPHPQLHGSVTMKAVELFAGAGGLALGADAAGFHHEAIIECDPNACETIRANNRRGVVDWPLFEGDVRGFDFRRYGDVDLLSGGPPCQPFSIGGKHRGHVDHRNLFPEAVRAVRELLPKAILIENVKGLLRPAFTKFYEYVILQLTYPEITQKEREDWVAHLGRLERHHTRGTHGGLSYNVTFRCLNAANYGVPQKRDRVFIVGFRCDIPARWSFPEPTHSLDSLLHAQWVTGEYWDRHRVATKDRPIIPGKYSSRLRRLRSLTFWPDASPWRTVRDAISDLPDPTKGESGVPNHQYNPGARAYGGHTGSPLDQPAKTLKAGDHGVPGGENMLAHRNGRVRYFTVRESARLQTFPDSFIFEGSWTESMRQLGNAVPVDLATVVAKSIAETSHRLTRCVPGRPTPGTLLPNPLLFHSG
jgi:DNA (cytosine-5)-methyltransferase 1